MALLNALTDNFIFISACSNRAIRGSSVMAFGRKKALCLLTLMLTEEEELPRSRSVWVHKSLARRSEHGEFRTWFAEEKLNAGSFHSAFRMTPERFEEILELVAPRLTRETTNYRKPICPAERLAITLR